MRKHCENCNKKPHEKTLIFSVTIKNLITNQETVLVMDKKLCKRCQSKFIKDWYFDNDLKYSSGGFKKQFWINFFPQYTELIKNRRFGQGTLQHYISSGRTQQEYLEKNKKLSVGYQVLKNRFGKQKALQIKINHSKKSAVTNQMIRQNHSEEQANRMLQRRVQVNNSNFKNKKQYWINKGYSQQQSVDLVSQYQSRSLQFMIRIYGQQQGTTLYKQVNKKKFSCGGCSKDQIQICKFLKQNIKDEFYNYENMFRIPILKQYKISHVIKNHVYLPDFVYKNKIVQFFGNYWHANPNKYTENEIISLPSKKQNVCQIWENDRKKIQYYKYIGYQVLVVWQSQYKSNKQETLDKILEFLKGQDQKNNESNQ